MTTYICQWKGCCIEFEHTKRGNKPKYCCTAHRLLATKPSLLKRLCEICSEVYSPVTGGQKYCSKPECKKAGLRRAIENQRIRRQLQANQGSIG